jgi:FKBP-type peptidyl-prolyl cis-trans isomerase
MTSSAPPRGRTSLIVSAAAVGALLIGTLGAQTPATSPGAGAGANSPPAAGAGAPSGRKAPGGSSATGAAGEKNSVSYSIGVSMGEQLHAGFIKPGDVNVERLAQGVRDGLSGKAKLSDADREQIMKLVRGAHEAVGETNHKAAAAFLAENLHKPDVVTTASGLQYKVLEPGAGTPPKPTDEVTVNYRGTLIDGTEFDSSYKRGQPATFQLNHVIPGWSEGLQLMKPGAKYQLFVPPQLAYDLRSPPGGPVPPGALLIFEVELLSVKPPQAAAAPAPSGSQPAAPAQPATTQPAPKK